MPYDTSVRLLDRQFDITATVVVDAAPATNTIYVDPHLVVLATLLAFWAVYIGFRIREVITAAV
ncbi:MAG: hypothetical protein ACI8U4_002410 [Natronomonas sp.]|jgi:hypothetical protein